VWCDYEGAMPAWLPDARVSLASPPSLLPAAGMLHWMRILGAKKLCDNARAMREGKG
jgi:hypothetical protein